MLIFLKSRLNFKLIIPFIKILFKLSKTFVVSLFKYSLKFVLGFFVIYNVLYSPIKIIYKKLAYIGLLFINIKWLKIKIPFNFIKNSYNKIKYFISTIYKSVFIYYSITQNFDLLNYVISFFFWNCLRILIKRKYKLISSQQVFLSFGL